MFKQTKYTKYYVEDNGKVFSETTYLRSKPLTRELSPTLNHKRGYLHIRTTSGAHQVHRLVAKAFIDNPYRKPCVNHKDSNRLNNNVANLEWVTHKENTQHAISNGRIVTMGKNEGKLKYTTKECRDVIQRVHNGLTYIKAGEKYGMPYSTVAHLIRGSRRKI